MMDCLARLGIGWIEQEEAMEFNNFMHGLENRCHSKRLNEFCELLVPKNVILINKDEVVDNDVTEVQAKAILFKSNRAHEKAP